MSLRKRLANSRRLNRFVVGLFAGWLGLVRRTSRFERVGFDALEAHLATGAPVIMLLWHGRLGFSPFLFDARAHRIVTLTSDARAGRLAGQIQARFGFETVPMSSHRGNQATSRAVLKGLRAGVSVGIAADGPRGPRRVMKDVPLDWARISGARIVLCAGSVRRFWRWGTWDALMFPWPFGRGVLMAQIWEVEVPRALDDTARAALRARLEADLTVLTDAADRHIGIAPGDAG